MNEAAIMAGAQGFAALYGLVLGSFCAAAIVRLPEGRSMLTPSACPRCGTRLTGADLVPVVSWLRSRGRCRHCGAPISPLYPLVEALCGILGWLVFRHLFSGVADFTAANAAAWVVQLGFLLILVVAATVDVRHRIIPNETSSYAALAGIAGHAVLDWLGYDGFLAIGVVQSVAGALAWSAFFGSLALFWEVVLKREGLGWGDVKLAAMLGAFLGFLPAGLFALMMGSLIGVLGHLVALVVRRSDEHLPYGPALAAGAAIYVLYGDVPLLAPWIV